MTRRGSGPGSTVLNRFPRILWRYVLREVTYPTLLAVVALTFFILTITKVPGHDQRLLLVIMRLMFREEVSQADVVQTFFMALPTTLLLITPMALLIGVMIGVGRMTLDLEVRAMQTGGLHLLVVFAPLLGLAGALSAGSVWLYYDVEPRLVRASILKAGRLLVSEFANLQPGRVYDELFQDLGGLNLYFGRREPETGAMGDVTLLLDRADFKEEDDVQRKLRREEKLRDLRRRQRQGEFTEEEYQRLEYEIKLEGKSHEPLWVFADRAAFATDPALGAVRMELNEGSIHILEAIQEEPPLEAGGQPVLLAGEGSAPAAPTGERDYVMIEFGRMTKVEAIEGQDTSKERRTLTIPELWRRSADNDLKPRYRLRAKATALERYALSLECLLFAFVGLPLAIWLRPTGKSLSVTLALALTLVYHLLTRTGYTMVESEKSIGAAVIFSPILVFAVAGTALWWRALRH